MPFGTEMLKGLGVHFRIFAPGVDQMRLQLDNTPGPLIMNSPKGGWRRSFIRNAAVGTRYSFILPDRTQVPDPASRYLPENVVGPSEVIDPKQCCWDDVG